MKHIKTLKAAMSVLCVLSILLGAVLTFSLIGAAAGEIPTNVTEVTWSDYLYDDASIALDQPIVFNKASAEYQGGGRFNDTLFNGDITFPSANEASLILFGDNRGVNLVPDGDTMTVEQKGTIKMVDDAGAEIDPFELKAASFGLTSFEDVRFNLKAAMFDNTDGKSATVSVWINNIHAFTVKLSCTRDQINGNLYPVQGNGRTAGNPSIVPHAPTEPDAGDDDEPVDFTKLTWGDFGMANYYAGSGVDKSGAYLGDLSSRLENVLFSGYITQTGNSQVNVFGPKSNPNWGGIKFLNPTDTKLSVQGSVAIPNWGFNVSANAVGLDTFVGKEYHLKVSAQYVDHDGDGSADDLKLGMWINDVNVLEADAANAKPADDGYCYFLDHTDYLTACVMVYHPADGTTLLRSDREVPADLTEVSWENYQFQSGSIALDQVVTFTGGSMTYQGGTYEDKIFNGDITFPSANDSGLILFGDWHGMYIIPDGAELKLSRQGAIAYSCGNYNLRAETFGLTSFEDVRLNLKATLTTNAAGKKEMSIWINDIHAVTAVLMSGESNANFNILPMQGNGATGGTPAFIPHAPGGSGEDDEEEEPLEQQIPEPVGEITWSDFGVTSDVDYNAGGWLFDSKNYVGFGGAPNGYKFNGLVKLANNAVVNYGAEGLQWGFHITQNGVGLVIDCYGGQGTLTAVSGKKAYTAAELGITGAMADTEFKLSIQMWNVTSDNKKARFAVWVNDKLLGIYDLEITHADVLLGRYTAIHDTTKTSVATSYYGDLETLPTDYTELTYADFGMDSTVYTVNPGTGFGKTFTTDKITSWDKVILTLESIKFAGDIELSFAGENEWLGFKLMARNNESLMFQSAHTLTVPRIMLSDAIAGVDLVGGEAYKLQITMAYKDANTLEIGLWFNGVLYNNAYIYADLSVFEPGSGSESVQLATKFTMGVVNVGDEVGSITLAGATTPNPGPGPEDPNPDNPNPDNPNLPTIEIPTPNNTLTWTDFTNNGAPLSNGTYSGYTYGWAGGYPTLDGVLFEGKIQMTAGSQISFGGKDPSHLIYLWLKADGTLNIRNNVGTIAPADGSAMDADFTAADLGISGGIADNPITLKFQFWNVSADYTAARVAIWINDTLLGVYDITVTNAAAQLGNAIGMQFGTYTLESIGGGTTPDPGPGPDNPNPDNPNPNPDPDQPYEYEATVEIPTPDKMVTWKDFGIRNGTYMMPSNSPYATYGYAAESLNNVLFEGKLKFDANTAVVYGGADPSWSFHVEYKNGVINIRNNIFTLSAPNGAVMKTSFTAADLGLEGAIGDHVLTLKMQMWNVAEDRTSGRIALWVNDKLLCIYDMVSNNPEEYFLGKGLGVLYGNVVIGDPQDNEGSDELPTGPEVYTEVTWESFGFADGAYYADNKGGEIEYREWIESGHYAGTINGTKFIGYITQGIRNQIRYGFANNNWAGIIFDISEEGNLLVQGSLNAPGWGFVVEPSMVGLTTFENTEYKLSISTAFVDADYDGFTDDVMLGIWVNDVLVAPLCINSRAEENGYVYLYDVAANFGSGLSLYQVHENRPITLRSAEIADPPPPPPVEVIPPPTNLHNITIGDFGGSLHAGEVVGSMSGQLKDLTSYDGTLFSADLNLITSTPGGATYLRFGGKTNGWEGFSLQTDVSGNLVLYNYLHGGSTLAFFDPAVAGVNFFEETFNLKMSFEFVDADGNGQKDDIKIGVYFNDALYNAEFIYVYDLAPEMTTYFLAYTDDAVAHPLWVDILQPEVVDLSMFGFSDNYKSQFGLTADQLKVNGVPLGSNYTPFSGDVATFCFWALIPMLALLGVLSVTILLSKKKQL